MTASGDLKFQADPCIPAELITYADACLRQCEEWFGPRPKPEWACLFRAGPQSRYRADLLRRAHRITVAQEVLNQDAAFMMVGHEIYHLVTALNPGVLQAEMWVDEMLATQASLELLTQWGKNDYAGTVRAAARSGGTWTSRSDLERARALTRWGWIRAGYPEGFPGAVARWGLALRYLVGWEAMTRLTAVETWGEWLAPAPPEERAMVLWLFGLEGAPGAGWLDQLPNNADRRTAAITLFLLGCDTVAGPMMEQVLREHPSDTEFLRYLADIAKARGDQTARIAAFRRLTEAEPGSWIAHYNLANVLSEAGDHQAALGSLQSACALNESEPQVLYNLGVEYRKLGDLASAQQWWKAALPHASGDLEALIRRTLKAFPAGNE